MERVLVIGSVWVEPKSSAAGSRMLQLLQLFLKQGWQVDFACAAAESDFAFRLSEIGIEEHNIQLNNSSFDAFIGELNPTLVLFDRFMTEEQYGWRVTENCPNALRILNTEDLHCLRSAREEALKTEKPGEGILKSLPITKREIASIYRSDLTLIISEFEREFLKTEFAITDNLLQYLPFEVEEVSNKDEFPSFSEREHFISIGNFMHKPNADAVLQLKQHIWKKIRKQLPKAELHIYGSYPAEKHLQLTNEKEGFFVQGRVEEAMAVLGNAKVLLAPLRFGAGLKGKFFDTMQSGTPSVTTNIGSEGIAGALPWCGAIENDWSKFTDKAVNLYKDESEWLQAQKNGFDILEKRFVNTNWQNAFLERIKLLQDNLEAERSKNFVGQLLQHHSMQSTKFMSKWIEEKNKVD